MFLIDRIVRSTFMQLKLQQSSRKTFLSSGPWDHQHANFHKSCDYFGGPGRDSDSFSRYLFRKHGHYKPPPKLSRQLYGIWFAKNVIRKSPS